MEQEHLFEDSKPASGCISCQHPVVEPGYPNALCKDCRTKLIKFPIPTGIKIFGIAILGLMVFVLIRTPQNLTAGIHFERGKKAIEEKRYNTAEHELKAVVERFPDFIEGKGYLAIAAYHNWDIATFVQTAASLQGKQIDNSSLYSQLSDLMDMGITYLPSDSFYNLIDSFKVVDSIPAPVLQHYLADHPDDLYANAHYAHKIFDLEKYAQADSVIDHILHADAGYFNALTIKTSIKRQLKQYDSALYYCDRILSMNHESAYAMASRARTFLRQKKDAEGLQWALKSVNTDAADGYALATLVLAYHSNKNEKERDRTVEQIKKDSAAIEYLQFANDVMSGKEKFRD